MSRWAARIEYVGTRYCGWQIQAGRESVQGTLAAALSKVADHSLDIVAAGRTDAGVHAYGQIVHFDSEARRTPYAWTLGTNTYLPAEIGLRWIAPVPAAFDARRSALRRRYRYLVHNHHARSAILAERAAWVPQALDAAAMHRAAQALLGERDFSAFRAAECQSDTPMRDLQSITAGRRGEIVFVDVCANAFLHHMVRNIAGVLIEIGLHRQPETWAAAVLDSRDRTQAAATAPARGLYFVGPEYPSEFGIPLPSAPGLP